jgi:hypothetical protein
MVVNFKLRKEERKIGVTSKKGRKGMWYEIARVPVLLGGGGGGQNLQHTKKAHPPKVR